MEISLVFDTEISPMELERYIEQYLEDNHIDEYVFIPYKSNFAVIRIYMPKKTNAKKLCSYIDETFQQRVPYVSKLKIYY